MKLEAGVSREASGEGADNHSPKRMRVLLAARLVTKFNDRPVTIRDLSSEGAMIEGGIVPSVGTEVILQRGWIEVSATVVWSDGRRCGLEFETVLCEDDFLTFRNPPLPIGPSIEAPTRRQWSLQDDPITPNGQSAGREWLHPAGRSLGRN